MGVGIGGGVYPLAQLDDVLDIATVIGTPVLVMGKTGQERHMIATSLRAAGCDVTRRHWENDNSQIDWTLSPEQNADHWYGLNLGGLNPAYFNAIYHRTVGPNELADNSAPEKFDYLAELELCLAKKHQADNTPYVWGSIAVGNIDPLVFATTFAAVNNFAAGVCAHVYVAPNRVSLEPPDEQDYARRPYAWFVECQKRGVRFPALLCGESGTYYPWTEMNLNEDQYLLILQQIAGMLTDWRDAGMNIIGQCLFSIGAEGVVGQQWNVSANLLIKAGLFNKEQKMSLADQYPNEYKAWVAAGGIDNNFRKHLLGIGSIAPTLSDARFLAQEFGADVDQMKAVLNKLPLS